VTTPSVRSVSRLTPKRAITVFTYRCIEMLPVVSPGSLGTGAAGDRKAVPRRARQSLSTVITVPTWWASASCHAVAHTEPSGAHGQDQARRANRSCSRRRGLRGRSRKPQKSDLQAQHPSAPASQPTPGERNAHHKFCMARKEIRDALCRTLRPETQTALPIGRQRQAIRRPLA
jgi:hypothetical protein